MKIKHIPLLFVITLFSLCLSAQTDPQFTNYLNNQLAFNPAYASANRDLNISLLGRSQWVGLSNAPQSFGVNAHTNVPSIGGIGITMLRDKLGYEINTAVKLSYAHNFNFSDSLSLSFGLSGGITSRSIDLDQLTFASSEPLLQNGSIESKIKPDFGFGIRFLWKKLDLQVASTHLTNQYDAYDYNSIPRHFYGLVSYRFQFNRNLSMTPSLFFRSNGILNQVDGNLRFLYQDRFLCGIGYRYDQAVIGSLGLKITDNLSFVYAYDFNTGASKSLSGSTHEIVLIGRLSGFYKSIVNNGSKASF